MTPNPHSPPDLCSVSLRSATAAELLSHATPAVRQCCLVLHSKRSVGVDRRGSTEQNCSAAVLQRTMQPVEFMGKEMIMDKLPIKLFCSVSKPTGDISISSPTHYITLCSGELYENQSFFDYYI